MYEISWAEHVRKEEVSHRVKEKRNILHTVQRRKDNWVGHILCRNWLLLRTVEGKVERMIGAGSIIIIRIIFIFCNTYIVMKQFTKYATHSRNSANNIRRGRRCKINNPSISRPVKHRFFIFLCIYTTKIIV